MFWLNRIKHLIHCVSLLTFVTWLLSSLLKRAEVKLNELDPWIQYGTLGYCILFTLKVIVLTAIPQILFNILGLIFFDAFPEKVTLRCSSLLTPLICIRVVTRGDFPHLVRNNVAKNMARCSEAGMDNFLIEVVSDKAIALPSHPRVREIVIPSSYKPRRGALYKARALQYCLEDDVNILSDNDYVVHLDEETIMTSDSIRGILNFVLEKKYDFGQGLITYANGQVVNWFTTLADSIRVADDMGKLRAQFYLLHKPVFSWKGSFMVSRVGAERDVSFDHGVNGSIAEDCYFAMRAFMKGYNFDFIDGEMYEKSPFTVWDFVQQRKRWVQGVSLVVRSPEITWKHKMLLSCSWYAWITMPLSLSNTVFDYFYPLPVPIWLNILSFLIGAVKIYMYLFGVIKSLSLRRLGLFKYGLCLISTIFVMFLSAILECIAVVMAVCDNKRRFYVVNKNPKIKIQIA